MQAALCATPSAPTAGGPQRRHPVAAPAAAAPRSAEPAPTSSPAALERRALLGAAAALAAAACQPPAWAIQGLTAGRIPGVSGPDADGWYTYTRPEGKSGGHGVGWSEIQRYSFKVPSDGWEEVPVSIADLGGTEIDLRYGSTDEGSAMVVVAPVLRFKDVGINANVNITDLSSPDNLIAGFAPELYGTPLIEDDILSAEVVEKDGLPYYVYELTRHRLVSATATGNRLYMLSVRCNSLQWRKSGSKLEKIRDSFRVPPKIDV
ncbi:domain-containing 4 [Chlorella sorokiniana]|uniref:Domain-containing 4 n=1 Tax=Chlorella sorokiniana TaxID=3076 RepID=A0A2P6TG17_CHLSO|nr:domain-containing 4 [Chlorella sorokiniana]|eukprot:PRW33039.1 domain-containing 4 [Chlorella sorokiniana]